MEIEFTDESLPLEEELMNFDMRSKSSRLNFFEKDVEGRSLDDILRNNVDISRLLTRISSNSGSICDGYNKNEITRNFQSIVYLLEYTTLYLP